MEYGAKMTSYEEIRGTFQHLPTTQLTRIIYRHYSAVSSEAYLLLNLLLNVESKILPVDNRFLFVCFFSDISKSVSQSERIIFEFCLSGFL